ncbi:hypothetical protein [Sphingomonas hengshuiensis]|uniref:hypothetical protein n=1 Tax=Sphingomonas hengshuiensis TaxID=1609977 RepID=UPI0005C9E224|nr:hypothetical protein [Sphingomonas hengshuiensis]
MDPSERELALRRHESLEYIGLRAQATVVGLSQLCTELVAAGVLNDAAIGRIKKAIQQDISVSRPRTRNYLEFERAMQARLDAIFPQARDPERTAPIGTTTDMEDQIGTPPEDIDAGS